MIFNIELPERSFAFYAMKTKMNLRNQVNALIDAPEDHIKKEMMKMWVDQLIETDGPPDIIKMDKSMIKALVKPPKQ